MREPSPSHPPIPAMPGGSRRRTLLDRHPDLTAVATANDLLALGLYLEMRARGLACPGDLSVVGHNDMPMIDMVDPPLTTIHIHHGDMGRQAAELLLKQIGKPDAAPIIRVIEPELVLRGSTAPPLRRSCFRRRNLI